MHYYVVPIVPILLFLTLRTSIAELAEQRKCIPRDFGFGSFVCVCNSTHCDSLSPIQKPPSGHAVEITSDRGSKRWFVEQSTGTNFSTNNDEAVDITLLVNENIKYQTIVGFGGAFTDATGINVKSVSQPLQDFIIRGYFGSDGLEYNLGRVPIGGSDFSTHPYSYDDLNPGQEDPQLKYFSLRMEDFDYKIPLMKKAMALSSERGVEFKFYGSPWAGPGWMKTNGRINGKGSLLKKYYSSWASYIVKFLQAYGEHGISFYGLTAQNEPYAGLVDDHPFNAMGWMPEEQGEWIGEHLGPQMHKSGYENVTIFILDDQRPHLPLWAIKVFTNTNASQYVGGIAVHWYNDFESPLELLDETHSLFPSLPILYTEACSGASTWDFIKVMPGSWIRAENYAEDIITNLQHWAVGWTDWNLALDMEGGPNWVNNFVDSPVIVNQVEGEVYRQPMYYALAHFSKVLPGGSTKIATLAQGKTDDVYIVAFLRPDGALTIIFLNRNHFALTIEVCDAQKRRHKTILGAQSLKSLIWTNENEVK